MPVVLKFVKPDLEFLTEQVLGVLGAITEHIMYTEELRLMVYDHTGVRRDGYLAISESVKSIDGFIRRHVVRQVDHDVDLVGGEIVDFLYLDLALLLRLED